MDNVLISSVPADVNTTTDRPDDQELLGVQTVVEPDGSAMLLILHTSQGSIRISVPFGNATHLDAAVNQAALLMLYRQTAAPDQPRNPLDDLIRAALRPSRVSVGIDRQTGDRLFVQEYGGERLPHVVRMSADAVNDCLIELSSVAAAHAN